MVNSPVCLSSFPDEGLPGVLCDDGTTCFTKGRHVCDGYFTCKDKADEEPCAKYGEFLCVRSI